MATSAVQQVLTCIKGNIISEYVLAYLALHDWCHARPPRDQVVSLLRPSYHANERRGKGKTG